MKNDTLKLNIGCGADLRPGYINIDKHTKELIAERYDIGSFASQTDIMDYDIFDLPYGDGEVDEVMCLGFLEHLSFEDEGRFFKEVKRVLKEGGKFVFTVPDFDSLARQWLEAKDDFKEFYRLGNDEHWFGNGNRTMKNKWGYLTAFIFGNQYGEGQFHRNAYTKGKIKRLMEILNFTCELSTFTFKNTDAEMIKCVGRKQ